LAGQHNITIAALRGNPKMFFSENHERTLRELQAIIAFSVYAWLKRDERARIANVAGADLFICVHSNAAPNPDASGVEVYYPAEAFRVNGRSLGDVERARDIATREMPDGLLAYDGDLGATVTVTWGKAGLSKAGPRWSRTRGSGGSSQRGFSWTQTTITRR
jgi:hypothetical protein